ncbi:uncharacterized protein LOC113847121 [Abrus precatorius]|uniref:Uncharacterized protein LOC113847121 n=1 Tax=Abrus precatorius TaxID=3816 RepID=A0A8B8JK59_ABRPR|nr:uncharacterized protein LOC113847121 [Abrus precatorius]
MLPTKPNRKQPPSSSSSSSPSSSSPSSSSYIPQSLPIPISNSPSIADSDLDIATMIAHFLDQPNASPLHHHHHHHQSNDNGDQPEAREFLKREFDSAVDFFATDDFAAVKRTRINDNAGNDDSNAVRFAFELHGGGERKEPLVEIDFLSNAFREDVLALELGNQDSDTDTDIDVLPYHRQTVHEFRRNQIIKRFRQTAKENASRFARFETDVKDEGEEGIGIDDSSSSTPFAIAMRAIKDREMKISQKGCVPASSVTWVSKRNQEGAGLRFRVPSLRELSLKVLADNADAIVSLEGVPDELRHRLSQLLCDSRKMNIHFFELLLDGSSSPTEIRLKDCSWLTEEQFTKCFQTCDTSRLEVLQLDQCGRCIPDYALHATLARSARWLPRLTSLSLSGACRLSDKGLQVLVSSAPVLRSINLSQCSLLTSASLNILANSLGSLLKELYLDDCQITDAALIVPALKKLEHLEVLSLAGIQTVCDEFIKDYITARGHNMKELVLKDCIKLTDASIKVIAEHCPGLCALDLMNLHKLTDLSVRYLTNNCQALHTLKLCRNSFSDEAIAAFLEIKGESMKELSLNNIKKVGHHTTLSLARHAKTLHTLDLSWCRNLMDNELGLIVDSCFSLRLLKLFGCSQVTDVFMNGHSNLEIQIVGLKMSPLLQHVKVPDSPQRALRYQSQ